MSLRFTEEDLERLKPNIRQQVAPHLDAGTAHTPVNCAPARQASTNKAKANRPEEDAGRLLVEWIDLVVLPNGLRPGLFFMHTPNGLARNATQGGIFKAQGLRKGWPDYSLDLPLGGYHGARLELKSKSGAKPSREQLDILARLESVGFKCFVAWGFEQAREQLSEYLDFAG